MTEMRVTGMPSRYVQGPGALSEIAEHVLPLGGRALVVVDRAVVSSVGDRIRAGLSGAGIRVGVIEYEGELTDSRIVEMKDRT